MNFIKHIKSDEKGHIFILSLIILALGCMTLTPLLDLMSTSIKSTAVYQNKMKQTYASDSGIEDAAQKMIKNVPGIQALADGSSWTYTLSSINGMPVTVTISKISLLDGLLGSNEYKLGQPHTGWVQYQVPPAQIIRNYEENWVEFYCILDFNYTGGGNRRIEWVGVYFAPFPGDASLISDPYDIVYIPVMNTTDLDSIEKKVVTGGFAFIWRWKPEHGPQFTSTQKTGSVYFKFRVNDASWMYTSTFMWATFKEQDISYITDSQLNKWLVQSNAGQVTTKVQALEDEGNSSVAFLTWERN